MKTLAYNMRPESLNDILGQKHIIGKNKLFNQMVEKKHPLSVILYGTPGCGKTTLAKALAHDLDIPYRLFNASTSNKKEMDAIIEEAKMSDGLFVIIDEIHRLNKDKQDHLLPHIESGLLTIAGCTTANPFHSINPAIRSRCTVLNVLPLSEEDVKAGLKQALTSEKGLNGEYVVDEEVLDKIARISSGDIRFAYNTLEMATVLASDNHVTIEMVSGVLAHTNVRYDKDEDQYYDTLSGLQKSIRGSDPNGAMYYFAKLIEAGDIESLERRCLVIAYEDIGLANPNACMRTVMAFEAAKKVGFPEARIILAQAILDLALSPKSRSAEASIDAAIASINKHSYEAPRFIRLSPVGLEDDERYSWDRRDLWEYYQYLPDEVAKEIFYRPEMNSSYERTLAENYMRILKHGRSNKIKELNNSPRKDKK